MKKAKKDFASYRVLNDFQMKSILGGQWVRVVVNGELVWVWL